MCEDDKFHLQRIITQSEAKYNLLKNIWNSNQQRQHGFILSVDFDLLNLEVKLMKYNVDKHQFVIISGQSSNTLNYREQFFTNFIQLVRRKMGERTFEQFDETKGVSKRQKELIRTEFETFKIKIENLMKELINKPKDEIVTLQLGDYESDEVSEITVTREEFEQQNADLFNEAKECIHKTLQNIHNDQNLISCVVPFGKCYEIPGFIEMIRGMFSDQQIVTNERLFSQNAVEINLIQTEYEVNQSNKGGISSKQSGQ